VGETKEERQKRGKIRGENEERLKSRARGGETEEKRLRRKD
jgi:hypothetical protein